MQELGDTTPFANSNEPGLKRRCIVMLELSATLARVLEFLTSRLPDVFLAGPPLNLSRWGRGAITQSMISGLMAAFRRNAWTVRL